METLYHAGLTNAVTATVLAIFVACAGRLLRRRPAVVHSLWLIVLLKLVTPPIYEIAIPWPERWGLVPPVAINLVSGPTTETMGEPAFLEVDTQPSVATTLAEPEVVVTRPLDAPDSDGMIPVGDAVHIDWMKLAMFVWLSGAVVTLSVSLMRIIRFQKALTATERASDETQEWVDALAARLGIVRAPSVWWVDGRIPPLIWSLGVRPRMIIPRSLWKSLDDRQRTTLIVHELAHVQRGDHRVRIFELVVTALYWWHPVLWWARKALRDAEEQCADAWVVWACPDSAKSYAETLLETLDFLNRSDFAQPLFASGFGKVHHLRKRLTMIMTEKTPRSLGLWGTLGALGLGALLLPAQASWAQKTEEQKLEYRLIINDESDQAASESRTAMIVSDDANYSADVAVVGNKKDADAEGAKAAEFDFEFRVDDSPAIIVSGPLDEAMTKLKSELDKLESDIDAGPDTAHLMTKLKAELDHLPKDGKLSAEQKERKKAVEHAVREMEEVAKMRKERKKALEHAVRELEKVVKKAPKGAAAKELKSLQKMRIQLRNNSGDAKVVKEATLSPEKKAEIDQARTRVKALAAELTSKQKELREAQMSLNKLVGAGRLQTVTVATPLQGRVVERQVGRMKEVGPLPTKSGSGATTLKSGTERRAAEQSEKRLENLEKKLEKLLEEVAALKKDRAK